MTQDHASREEPTTEVLGSDQSRKAQAPAKARVLVIEDQSAICDMIAEIVQNHPGCELVGKGQDGIDAVRLAQQLRPDILVLDIIMPGIDGVEVLHRLRDMTPQMKVLVFSGMKEARIIRSLIRDKVHGFVHKNQKLGELRNALGALIAGQKWLKDDDLMMTGKRWASDEDPDSNPLAQLTRREREIATLIAQSHSSKEIAEVLNLSEKTVSNHRVNLMRKLRVRDVAGVVRLTFQAGLC